jgi:hypothetical protein
MKNITLYLFFLFLTGTCKSSYSQIISTVAGNGTYPYSGDGGPATSAGIYAPMGVAADATGNIYITDYGNNRIRKVSVSGIITTVAGNGNAGYSGDGASATSAELSGPWGITLDGSGNIYIADEYNNCIRKINSSGIISTVAGNGVAGFSGDNGAATLAKLNSPCGLAFDGSGNMYIADMSNSRIRKVNTSGIITTIGGNGTKGFNGDGGPATSAELFQPTGVAIDHLGNIFIADSNLVRKINPSGTITTFAGNGTMGFSGDGAAAIAAEINGAFGIAADSAGSVYISDVGNNRIRRINTSGIISTIAGDGGYGSTGDGGIATSAQIGYPAGIGFDGKGSLFIADQSNYYIRKVTEITGTDDQDLVALLKIYPNPSNGAFQITLNSCQGQHSVISVFDLLGNQILKDSEINSGNNMIIKEFDLSPYPKGMYLVKIYDGTSVFTDKIIVQ